MDINGTMIKPATEADFQDLKEMCRIHNEGHHDLRLYPFELKKSVLTTDSQVTFISYGSGKKAGFFKLHCKNSFESDDTAECEFIISTEFQRKGFASALLEKALEFLTTKPSVKYLTASIVAGNYASKALCKKFNFEEGNGNIMGSHWRKSLYR